MYEDQNPETGISFKDDRFVVTDATTEAVKNFNAKWRRLDGGPVVGGFGNEKWYFKQRPEDQPESTFDHRYAVATSWVFQDTSPAPAEGHPHGRYTKQISGTLRTPDELKAQVDTQHAAANNSLYSPANDPAFEHKLRTVQARKADGVALDAQDLAVLAEGEAIYDQMKQNDARRDELYRAIDAEEEYDLTEGWLYGNASVPT